MRAGGVYLTLTISGNTPFWRIKKQTHRGYSPTINFGLCLIFANRAIFKRVFQTVGLSTRLQYRWLPRQ
jgi:hypothetical protein